MIKINSFQANIPFLCPLLRGYINGALAWFFFFFLSGFPFTDTDDSQDSRRREENILFHSTTSASSWTFRHLFATLHGRWLSHIFSCTACIYQTATLHYLPPYRITILLIDDVIFVFYLFTWWFDSRFSLQQFDTGNWWTRTRIHCHPLL